LALLNSWAGYATALGLPFLAGEVHLRLAIEGKNMFTYDIGYVISKYLYIHL